MPYNSSSFEKQLAKYKAGEGMKKAAEAPKAQDIHAPRSRVASAEGKVQSSVLKATQLLGDGPQATPVLRADQLKDADEAKTVIIVQNRKKPLYTRGWFVFLVFSILSTALTPVLFPGEVQKFRDLMANIKTTTGVDPMSVDTYKDMIKNQISGAPAASTPAVAPAPGAAPDMTGTVQAAQDKAADVVKQGPDASMEYIRNEADRLNNMARELDKQSGATGH